MLDTTWSTNLLLNPSALLGLVDWTITGDVTNYAAQSADSDSASFRLGASSSMKQVLAPLVAPPESIRFIVSAYCIDLLGPKNALVKIEIAYADGKDVSHVVICDIVVTEGTQYFTTYGTWTVPSIEPAWSWKRTMVDIPLRDPENIVSVSVEVVTTSVLPNPLYVDSIVVCHVLATQNAKDIGIVHQVGDTGVDISRDGVLESWAWVKDVDGRITSMTSDRGRTILVTY